MEFETGGTSKSLLPGAPLSPRADAVRLVAGHAADHKLIHALLRAVNQAPTYEAFLSSLEEPSYEPTDRLLVKRGTQIVAHVQMLHRTAWFQGVRLPITQVESLATLPELQDAGYDRLLFSAVEQSLHGSQAIVAFARTDRGEMFRSAGWSEISAPFHTEANVNDVLCRLASSPATSPLSRRESSLRIRLWRHVELEALLEVARQSAASTWGGLDRSEAYWRWLVGRNVHDDLIVAIDGPDEWDILDAPSHIVGYAVTRGSQMIELGTLRDFHRSAPLLLARACQDAIEHDHRTVSLHLPPADPLHELLLAAGGCQSSASRACSTVGLVKLLDPARWIENLYPVLLERAKAADLARPLQIGFDTGRRKYRFELTRRSSHLALDDAAPCDVTCSLFTMGALLVGNLDVPEAQQTGRIHVESEEIAERLAALFPRTAFWQSQFDAL